MSLLFQWDPYKAATNAQKHGISFEEAITVFDDPLARIFIDEWHSKAKPARSSLGTRVPVVFYWSSLQNVLMRECA